MWARELFRFSVVLGSQSEKSGTKERGSQKQLLLQNRMLEHWGSLLGSVLAPAWSPSPRISLSPGSPRLDSESPCAFDVPGSVSTVSQRLSPTPGAGLAAPFPSRPLPSGKVLGQQSPQGLEPLFPHRVHNCLGTGALSL